MSNQESIEQGIEEQDKKDIYDDNFREQMIENDEISSQEQGFMDGYDQYDEDDDRNDEDEN